VYVLNVSAVSNVCCKLDVAYITKAIHVCCKCVFQIFQLFHLDIACFHLDVAYVVVAIHVCSKCMFQMFHLFQMYIARVLSGCCYMLQWLYTYVVNVCFNCFTCFSTLQQVLLPTRFDSRACTCCTHPSNAAYTCHVGQLQ
jgi:hypothetical protein